MQTKWQRFHSISLHKQLWVETILWVLLRWFVWQKWAHWIDLSWWLCYVIERTYIESCVFKISRHFSLLLFVCLSVHVRLCVLYICSREQKRSDKKHNKWFSQTNHVRNNNIFIARFDSFVLNNRQENWKTFHSKKNEQEKNVTKQERR